MIYSALQSDIYRFVVGQGEGQLQLNIPSTLFHNISDPLDSVMNFLGFIGDKERKVTLPDDAADVFIAFVEYAYRAYAEESLDKIINAEYQTHVDGPGFQNVIPMIALNDLPGDQSKELLRTKFLDMSLSYVPDQYVASVRFERHVYALNAILLFLGRLYFLGNKYCSEPVKWYAATNIHAALARYPLEWVSCDGFLGFLEYVWSNVNAEGTETEFIYRILASFVAYQGKRLLQSQRFKAMMLGNGRIGLDVLQQI